MDTQMYLFMTQLLILLGVYPEGELLGHMEVLFLMCWEAAILFSIEAAP